MNLSLGNLLTLYGHLFLGTCGWEPCLGTSSWKHRLGTSLLGTLRGHLFLETSSWKYLFENMFWQNLVLLGKTCPGNLSWETCWEPCLDTSSWKPLPGNTCLKHVLRTLFCLGKTCCSLGKRFLETLKTVPEIRACKTCSWEPCLGTCSWKTLPGNPCLGTSS